MSPEPRVKGLDIINILVDIRTKGNRPITWKDAGATCGGKISMVLPLLSRRAESKTALARVDCLLLLLYERVMANNASVVVQAAGFANLAFLASAAFLSASLKPFGG